MTKDEHELMIVLFTRLYQRMGQITETLKSRGLWSGDDERAFASLTYEREFLQRYAAEARREYLALANGLGLIRE